MLCYTVGHKTAKKGGGCLKTMEEVIRIAIIAVGTIMFLSVLQI